jgi:hypothetical protein
MSVYNEAIRTGTPRQGGTDGRQSVLGGLQLATFSLEKETLGNFTTRQLQIPRQPTITIYIMWMCVQ